MSDCFCHNEDKRSLQPWFVSSDCWCPEEREYLWVCECVYGVHGGCMWGYVAGVTFLHQLLLISPHSRHLKFRSRRDVVGFSARSEGVFLCVSLTVNTPTSYNTSQTQDPWAGYNLPAALFIHAQKTDIYIWTQIMLQIQCASADQVTLIILHNI